MPTKFFPSLRSRVWWLVALITAPLLADSFLVYLQHRDEAIARVERDIGQLIDAVRTEEGQLVAHTRQLLNVMADEIGDLDAARCSSLARRLTQTQRDFQNIGVVLPDGTLFCSGRQLTQRFNLSETEWFKDAAEHKEMSRGHYVRSRVTGRYGLVFAMPVVGKNGALRAIVYANTGVGWLERLVFASKLPQGWEATLLGPEGKPVFQHAAEGDAGAGRSDALFSAMSADSAGLREIAGQDGGVYLYGIGALDPAAGDFRIAVGVPKAEVLAEVERDFRKHLVLLALAGILSVAIGRFAIHHSFGAWAEHVHESLRLFRAGERNPSLPEDSSIRELREIDGALNQLFDDIKAAGSALRETRQDLGLALEGANLATWEWHLPDGTRSGNARLAEMLGYGPDAMERDEAGWERWICPDDLPTIKTALQDHFDGKAQIYESEHRLRHKDGHWVWVLARGRVVERDATGQPSRMAGTVMDITDRKMTELELRRRTEELAALLDAIPAPVWLARDPECRVILGNRATNQLYGMPSGTNLSQSSVDARQALQIRYFRADGREYAADELPMQRAVTEGCAMENCEIRLVSPDGRSVWLFGNAVPLFDDAGKVRGALAAFADVTQLRTMDEALRRNEMVLAQAGKMARLAAWSFEMHDPADLCASSVHWSDEGFRLFGYEPGEVVPSVGLFMAHIHPDDRQRVADEAARALAARQPFQCEFRIVRRDGAERIAVDLGEFRFDGEGRPTHFIGACQDVTEQKQAERELVRHRNQLETLVAERTYELAVAKEAAERASLAKSQFLANISHELRTPLNSLMLLAHVLSDNAWSNLTPQQIEYARMIELSGNDLVHLIDELLDLAKIEAGRLAIDVKSVPFPDIMQNVHRTHRHVAQQKGLDFKMEIGADVPASLLTDPLRLQQLLRNLVSNAIKFTHEGGVTLRIRRALSGWRYGNPALGNAETVIAFDVIDTGIGIPADQQDRIQEVFGRAHGSPSGDYGGSGLGLLIAGEIAALLGGELALSSIPGQGSTFTLYLPLNYLGPAKPSAVPAEMPPAESMPPAAEFDPILAGKTALVVDDDQRNRFALAAMLERQRMRVLEAPSGAEALDVLACEEVDIVLMDMMMPFMDGYQATRAIRVDLGRTTLPVIALTADAMPTTRETCMAAGCSDYLAKPVNNSELLAAMRQWLEKPPAN